MAQRTPARSIRSGLMRRRRLIVLQSGPLRPSPYALNPTGPLLTDLGGEYRVKSDPPKPDGLLADFDPALIH